MCDDSWPPLETSSEMSGILDMETPSPSSRPPKLLDRVRASLRVRHYSVRTEEAPTSALSQSVPKRGWPG